MTPELTAQHEPRDHFSLASVGYKCKGKIQDTKSTRSDRREFGDLRSQSG